MNKIRLLIVDDHPVVRDGLRGMFADTPDLEVLGEAANGTEALTLVESLRPDVVLMDLHMPEVDGVSAIRLLVKSANPPRILVLTTYDLDIDVLPAIEAGATGYLLKDAPREELLRAVRNTANGEAVLSPSVASLLVNQIKNSTRDGLSQRERLSQREHEILMLVASGTTNREIARTLFISEATVKTHLLHIYEKLGVRDRAAAVSEAYQRGVLH
jgi:DNA-binding NarL/FixJ family response regulator